MHNALYYHLSVITKYAHCRNYVKRMIKQYITILLNCINLPL